MVFQLSDALNEDKVFLVKRSELEGRLDCEYYNPSHYRDLALLGKSPYSTSKLKDVCVRIVDGPFGSAIKASDYVEDGVPFIRVADVTHGEGTIKNDNLIYISHEAHKEISRSKVIPGDVVIAKTGATMGAASVVPDDIPEANIRGDLAALTLAKDRCSSEYAITFINTPIGQRLFWRLDSGGTRGRVVIGNLKKYPIVTPPHDVQKRIVAKINAAYATKKQKEVQALQLFDSIDTFLLNELGIELPPEEENSISQRMFVRKLSEVSSGRFDPSYFEKRFTHLIHTIQQSSYKFVPLGIACSLLCSGKTPARDEYSEESTPYPIIKVASYQGDMIDLNKTDFAISKQPYSVEKGDIFVLSAAHQPDYVGRFVKQLDDTPEIPTSFVGELICLRANGSIINPYYLFGLFASNTFQTLMNREKRGQTSHIYSNDIKHILIPLPPLEKQNEIAAHIQTIRDQAKQLRAEAATGFEQAKREVEAMIIGQD